MITELKGLFGGMTTEGQDIGNLTIGPLSQPLDGCRMAEFVGAPRCDDFGMEAAT